jgi:hypothetical protein
MLFKVRNYELVKDREQTFLTAVAAVAGTTLTVKGVDANAWADNDWIIVGEIGTKNAEILQINGAVSDGTSLTVDNAGSSGARFAHAVSEPVYRIDYNNVEISRASTETGTKTTLTTNELQVDDIYTRYEDTVNLTGYGFVRFVNTFPTPDLYSSYSDAIPYAGYTPKSLGRMIKMVRRHLNEPDFKNIKDEDIIEELNEKQRDIAHERLWSFNEDTFSASSVAYQRNYEIDTRSTAGKVHGVTFKSDPLAPMSLNKFNIIQRDTSTTGEPTNFFVWNNKINLYPLVSSAAATTTLNGALNATAVSITLTLTSSFSTSGRIIVDSEVISYTSKSSTQLLGCTRGEEGTTAATHLTLATVTERDLIYTGYKEPVELVDTQDETTIPDPATLVYGADMELAIGKLANQVLHDRFKGKYDESIAKLREKFGKKISSSFARIKDKSEVVIDTGGLVNPNDFPINLK